MKYIVVLGDGMADTPVPELNGKTPLEAANTPCMDALAKRSLMGMVRTVPDGFAPGSDVANLSVMGYAPQEYYTGRSPLEAVSMGLDLQDNDITFRCNTVTLSDEEPFEAKRMLDYSSDEITTEESTQLIRAVEEALHTEAIHFFPGISYRHCMVWTGGHTQTRLTPPHDISDQPIIDHLPQGKDGLLLLYLMKQSYEILKDHPINQDRIRRGLKPANSIWLWGSGKKPILPSFTACTGKKGTVISAVDLVKGIGLAAGMDVPSVPGVTGNVHTNFTGKMQAALSALQNGSDFVYIHMEAPDEAGHRHEVENKVLSIEKIDQLVVEPLTRALAGNEYRMLIMPDHPTPLSIRTHVSDPVPFMLFDSRNATERQNGRYSETNGRRTGVNYTAAVDLMRAFLELN